MTFEILLRRKLGDIVKDNELPSSTSQMVWSNINNFKYNVINIKKIK